MLISIVCTKATCSLQHTYSFAEEVTQVSQQKTINRQSNERIEDNNYLAK